MAQRTRLAAIKEYFGEARAVTNTELKELTKAERDELVDAIAADTGWDIAAAK